MMLRDFDPQTRAGLELLVLGYDEQMERTRNHDQTTVASGIHKAMDRAQERLLNEHPLSGEVQCRKGCDHCCHMHVGVSLPEARLMVAEARKQGVKIDVDRLQRQKGRGIEGWRELSPEDRACSFLKDAACSIHAQRPAACRKLLVVSPADQCDQVANPLSIPKHLASPEAEVAYSVLLTRQRWGSMPDMILQAMETS